MPGSFAQQYTFSSIIPDCVQHGIGRLLAASCFLLVLIWLCFAAIGSIVRPQMERLSANREVLSDWGPCVDCKRTVELSRLPVARGPIIYLPVNEEASVQQKRRRRPLNSQPPTSWCSLSRRGDVAITPAVSTRLSRESLVGADDPVPAANKTLILPRRGGSVAFPQK